MTGICPSLSLEQITLGVTWQPHRLQKTAKLQPRLVAKQRRGCAWKPSTQGQDKNPAGTVSLVGESKGPTVSHRAVQFCFIELRYPIALTPGFPPDYLPTCHLLVLELSRANKKGKTATIGDSS